MGLVIESGLIDLKNLPLVQQLTRAMPQISAVFPMLPDPLNTLDKVS
jgi:hypothetical protein